MRFTIEASELSSVLQLASRTTDRKDPVKSCVKIEAGKNSVKVFSTTGHSGSCLDVSAKVKEAGFTIAPADALLKAIRECEGDTTITIKDNNVLITNQQLEYKVLTLHEAKTFPFTEKKDFKSYVIDLHELVMSMKIVQPTADTVHEVEFKGIGMTNEKGNLRLSVMSRSSSGGYSAVLKSAKGSESDSIICHPDFAGLIISLSQEDSYGVGIGIDKSSVSIKHSRGYTYLPQLTGRPFELEKYKSIWKLDTKPTMVTAGLFAKALRSVIIMGDKEEGYKGKMKGTTGKIELSSFSNLTGFARNSIITAGDLEVDNWYNFRTLHGYMSAIAPEEEIKVHTVAKGEHAALIVQYADHIFWLASCGQPEGVENAKSKPKAGEDVS